MSQQTMCLSNKPVYRTADALVETWCGRIEEIGTTLSDNVEPFGPYTTDATVCPTCYDNRQQAVRGQYLAARAAYFRDRRRRKDA